ncbi:hypothetical protein [Mucilaginibacter kameinonensis]|uniref:hypothetical protein n=1 Tax=Mucilaginibacter kameinonensis TaxID=452286 RepID=UPI000EF7BB93|nr:hypothetical protein [Mucilaginibacter kameinonensis]
MKHIFLAFFMLMANFCIGQTPVMQKTTTVSDTTVSDSTFDENAGNDPEDKKLKDAKPNILGALLSYNFSGNKKGLSNLTPVVNYGWTRTMATSKDERFHYDLSINPYVGGQIDIRDSTSYIPGLMLPGTAGITINNFLRFKMGKGELAWSPVNFGLKLVSNFADSTLTVVQHNLRSGLAFSYDDLFIMGIQYTYAWHNATSESEKTFKTVFNKRATDLQYLMISLQTKISSKEANTPLYFFAEWRGLLNQGPYKTYDNLKILTFGFRAEMNLNFGAPAKAPRRKGI